VATVYTLASDSKYTYMALRVAIQSSVALEDYDLGVITSGIKISNTLWRQCFLSSALI